LYHLTVQPQLHRYIVRHALFQPGDRVGAAVSGGADSVALLRVLLELRGELGIVLSAVHVHHGIRGKEADDDERFVAELAAKFDLPMHRERADVPGHAFREKISVESSARELRYEFFKRLLATGTCDKIATAHTLDDQAETVLLRIVRGTGTRGLAAIPPLRDASPQLTARIVRPLLGTQRSEIEAYLRRLGQSWREDSTNKDRKHMRNRVRHELLPLLEAEFNPGVRQSLVNLAEIARAEEEHWTAELAHLWPKLISQQGDVTSVSRDKLLAIPLALRRRALVDLADHLDLPVGFDDIELMLHLAEDRGTEHEFESGWLVVSSKHNLEFRQRRAFPQANAYSLPLEVPGSLELPTQLRIQARLLQAEDASRYNSATLLAYDRLELPLQIRNWQPGDRFWAAGSKQAEKLKRLFQERHIPAEDRTTWPVVLSGEHIVWVRDFPVAAEFQAENTKAVLIEAQPLDRGETRIE
jgi:tRNA(Ile)-lysidine synthase